MATGRIRRSARRGIAAAMLGWLGIVGAAVVMAPGASAAPSATIEIRNVTPPAASVDPGGRVTFVNKIPAQNKGGISIPLPVGSTSASATIFTDVSVTFFGQRRDLQPEQSAAWNFSAPATTGQIAYTYRIVPAAGTPAALVNQVVSAAAAGLPALPAPIPYVVQTLAPGVPNLPSVNIPQLPTVTVPPLPGSGTPPQPPLTPGPEDPPVDQPGGGGPTLAGASGPAYTYGSGAGVPRMAPSDVAAAAAFDPNRFYVPGKSLGGVDRAGSGGMAGSYDGASVPVFGQLAGLDGSSLDESAAAEEAAASSPGAQTLPAAALAAVVALVAVTAALVRTHQASRSSR
jgi:hypothetical protein